MASWTFIPDTTLRQPVPSPSPWHVAPGPSDNVLKNAIGARATLGVCTSRGRPVRLHRIRPRVKRFSSDGRGETRTLEPPRYRGRLIACRLAVGSRHQQFIMSTVYIMTRTPDLLPGTLDLLILRTLQKDALHGWAISERIQQISQDVLQINQGSLYPALHRLEHQD